MTRRHLISSLLVAPLVGSNDAAKPPMKLVCVPAPTIRCLSSSVIQCYLAPGEVLTEPHQAFDETQELVWSKVQEHEDGHTLHQRLYAPKGVYPKGYDPEEAMQPFLGVVWREVPA